MKGLRFNDAPKINGAPGAGVAFAALLLFAAPVVLFFLILALYFGD